MRKKIIAANWKMHMTQDEAASFLEVFLLELREEDRVEVVLCPPFTCLSKVSELLSQVQHVKVGAQNMHWEPSGAFTGEISAPMLRELYTRYVIIGHSERRQHFGETNEILNRKLKAALESSLRPIFCVGETLAQREAGQVEKVVTTQLTKGLEGVNRGGFADLVVAYEPVWAIGTGHTATPEQAQEVHALIRRGLANLTDDSTANRVRIQYGGSVKPDNTRALMQQPDIDGALVGGASLDPRSFTKIVKETLRLLEE